MLESRDDVLRLNVALRGIDQNVEFPTAHAFHDRYFLALVIGDVLKRQKA